MKKKIVALFLTMALMLSLCAVPAGAQTTLRLNARSAALGVGEDAQFTATTNSTGTIAWSSGDRSIARVNRNGVVSAVSEGVTFIRARVGGAEAQIRITVRKAPERIRVQDVTITVGEVLRVPVRMTSGSASRTKVMETSDRRIARGDDLGRVRGLREGTAEMTMTTFNGKSTTFKVTVVAKPQTVTIGDWGEFGLDTTELELDQWLVFLGIVDHAPLTNADIKQIAHLIGLRRINLSWQGSLTDFSPLYNLPNLEYVSLFGIELTSRQMDDIKAAMPNVQIRF